MSKASSEYDKLSLKSMMFLMSSDTLIASLLPSIYALLYGYLFINEFTWYKGIILIFACCFVHAMVNVLYNYYVCKQGASPKNKTIKSDDSFLANKNFNPKVIQALAIVLFAIAAILYFIGIIGTSYVPMLIVVIAAIIIYFFAGTSHPISNSPVGELFYGLITGSLIPIGILSCFDGKWHFEILLYSIPFVIGNGLMELSKNTYEIENKPAKRSTLPILLGREKTLVLYRVLFISWLISAVVSSSVCVGWVGSLVCLLFDLASYLIFTDQFNFQLLSKEKASQLKGIKICNLLIDGSIIISLLVQLIIELF